MANKKKAATAIVASVTALVLLAGGTFAWQSISQTALNEKEATINPGGRLHDDFNGTNKDVYVENFADNDIYARVRLDEYFEIVMNKGTPAVTTEVITEGATKGDASTYITHKFDEANTTDTYWSWETGGKTKYMPTFNMNKDSLVADINGTFENAYEDYVDYTDEANAEKIATEIYDGDSDDKDEVGTDFDNLASYADHIKTVENKTHTVRETVECKGLISVDEWLALYEDWEYSHMDEVEVEPLPDDYCDNYWVYDTDGWVYWSSPISAGTATGLLLDEISLKGVMDDSYYYAINVVGQFITADDLGKTNRTGFYADEENKPSYDALELLKKIGVNTEGEEYVSPLIVSTSSDPKWYVEGSAVEKATLTVAATFDGEVVSDEILANTVWTISDNSSSETKLESTVGKNVELQIGSDETKDITVCATLSYQGEKQKGYTYITNGPSVGSIVTYDANDFYAFGTSGYIAGKDNVYTTYFFEEYKGDVRKYVISEAYTGNEQEILAKTMHYEITNQDALTAGVTLSQTGASFKVSVPENYKDNISIHYSGAGFETDLTLRPAVKTFNLEYEEDYNSTGDGVTKSIDGDNIDMVFTPSLNDRNEEFSVALNISATDKDGNNIANPISKNTITNIAIENLEGNSITYKSVDDMEYDYTEWLKCKFSYITGDATDSYILKVNDETGRIYINKSNMNEGNGVKVSFDMNVNVEGIIRNIHVTFTFNAPVTANVNE